MADDKGTELVATDDKPKESADLDAEAGDKDDKAKDAEKAKDDDKEGDDTAKDDKAKGEEKDDADDAGAELEVADPDLDPQIPKNVGDSPVPPHRDCKDVLCLIFFFVFWGLMLVRSACTSSPQQPAP